MNPLERIDHWAAVAPTATAHISGDRKLTFGELGAHANALAAYLLERSGEDRAPVAVLGHREPEMLIAFIGVAKSGRPYIPIDTALPQERINHILAIDAGAPITVLGGVHIGCYELFASEAIHSIAGLKGKSVGLEAAAPALLSLLAAEVGLDPARDIRWVTDPSLKPLDLFAESKIDAFLGFPLSRKNCEPVMWDTCS